MSGGQRQRISFSSNNYFKKDILFGDEPTGNLDWYNVNKVMEYLNEELGKKKTASIIVTHDIEIR